MGNSIYSKDYKNLVARLKETRHDLKLDQNEVAKRIEKTQSYISKIESGQIRIDIIQLKQLAQIYNKPITYFLK